MSWKGRIQMGYSSVARNQDFNKSKQGRRNAFFWRRACWTSNICNMTRPWAYISPFIIILSFVPLPGKTHPGTGKFFLGSLFYIKFAIRIYIKCKCTYKCLSNFNVAGLELWISSQPLAALLKDMNFISHTLGAHYVCGQIMLNEIWQDFLASMRMCTHKPLSHFWYTYLNMFFFHFVSETDLELTMQTRLDWISTNMPISVLA